ncbi:hypothetical protein PM10SUCC1_18000 [Propionigenium maris DSM 9537]|uniref:Uncharacterized protein n=1 Tax=Propionigenium maris DSM 9537 TaxID=1123000 RepID=A0A9W6GM80_9FUSO|nr:hypothetical protein [Propionigenium maris]GLI56286.1 hypothetical protein PM10SUCC1_18000 [Propionigenium maris DSM 9537]
MFDYKIKLKGKDLEKSDEETLVCFLKMLDFSAEYLHGTYEADRIRFCPEERIIYVDDDLKHSRETDELSRSYGFEVKNQ